MNRSPLAAWIFGLSDKTLQRSLSCFQLLNIGEVLQASGGFLIRNQVVTRNDKGRYPAKEGLETILPGLRKINTSMFVIMSMRNGGRPI
jgi:hypothetical protein